MMSYVVFLLNDLGVKNLGVYLGSFELLWIQNILASSLSFFLIGMVCTDCGGFLYKRNHSVFLTLLSVDLHFLVDGAVMPSWFDIHEIPVTAVRSDSLYAFNLKFIIFYFHFVYLSCVLASFWSLMSFSISLSQSNFILYIDRNTWILNKFGQGPPTCITIQNNIHRHLPKFLMLHGH